MTENTVDNYGWNTQEGPISCGYIGPVITKELRRVGARRVMDLGSGNGALCSQLASVGFDVIGVEYDAEGVANARHAHPSIRFYQYGVQDDPNALLRSEALFDAVVSTEVIEHLYSPHLLLRYASQVLKPDGRLIITTPYHGYLKNLILSLLNKWDWHLTVLWHGGHIKFFSRATLKQLLEDNDFHVVAFEGIGRLPYLWKSMMMTAKPNRSAGQK